MENVSAPTSLVRWIVSGGKDWESKAWSARWSWSMPRGRRFFSEGAGEQLRSFALVAFWWERRMRLRMMYVMYETQNIGTSIKYPMVAVDGKGRTGLVSGARQEALDCQMFQKRVEDSTL